MLSKTLERYLSEPGIVEGSGFRHFVGNRVLQITYISDFAKLKVYINTLEAKISKIGIASYLRKIQHKMFRFATFCRELRAPYDPYASYLWNLCISKFMYFPISYFIGIFIKWSLNVTEILKQNKMVLFEEIII